MRRRHSERKKRVGRSDPEGRGDGTGFGSLSERRTRNGTDFRRRRIRYRTATSGGISGRALPQGDAFGTVRSAHDPAEGCRSGRTGRSRKPLCLCGHRGFESHPLRHRHAARPLRGSRRRLDAAYPVVVDLPYVDHRRRPFSTVAVETAAHPAARPRPGRHLPGKPSVADAAVRGERVSFASGPFRPESRVCAFREGGSVRITAPESAQSRCAGALRIAVPLSSDARITAGCDPGVARRRTRLERDRIRSADRAFVARRRLSV